MKERHPCATPGCKRSAYGRLKCDRCRKADKKEAARKRRYTVKKV